MKSGADSCCLPELVSERPLTPSFPLNRSGVSAERRKLSEAEAGGALPSHGYAEVHGEGGRRPGEGFGFFHPEIYFGNRSNWQNRVT